MTTPTTPTTRLRQLSVLVPLATPMPNGDLVLEVFHRWIRQPPLPLADQLLIDVVDYRHVPSGPGFFLVANEGFYSLSEAGLRWSVRRDEPGPAAAKITAAATRAQAVSALLAAEPTLNCAFDLRRLEISTKDRRLAPSGESLAEIATLALSADLGVSVQSTPDRRDPRGPVAVISRIG